MIQSFRRRAAAVLCAVALMVALVAHPLQARAASATLAAVGAGVTVAAFLMACGIYPYAEGESFAEWAARDLEALWQQFTQAHATQVAYSSIKAFVLGGVLCYPRVTWDALRDFAVWIKEAFALTDNSTGVQIGVSGTLELPVFGGSGIPSAAALKSRGWSPGVAVSPSLAGYTFWYGAPVAGYIPVSLPGADKVHIDFISTSSARLYYAFGSSSTGNADSYISSYIAAGSGTRVYHWSGGYVAVTPDGVRTFSGVQAAIDYYFGDDSVVDFAGIVADTGDVAALGELPAGAEFGGLQVAGLGEGATAGALEDTIESGVMERQQPIVRPVEIEVQQGLDIDVSTGEIAENPVVITPTDIPLVASDYSIPGLSSVFPFSVPWDIMRVFQALDAEPTNPLDGVSLTLDIPWLFGDSPPVVEFGLGAFPAAVADKMDDVLAMVRAFLLVIACVVWLIFISGFIRF